MHTCQMREYARIRDGAPCGTLYVFSRQAEGQKRAFAYIRPSQGQGQARNPPEKRSSRTRRCRC